MPDTYATTHNGFRLHLDNIFLLGGIISKNVHCQDDNASRWTRLGKKVMNANAAFIIDYYIYLAEFWQV